jgi:hypothetical protein
VLQCIHNMLSEGPAAALHATTVLVSGNIVFPHVVTSSVLSTSVQQHAAMARLHTPQLDYLSYQTGCSLQQQHRAWQDTTRAYCRHTCVFVKVAP